MKRHSLLKKITYAWLTIATIFAFSPQLSAQDLDSPDIVRHHIKLAYTQPSFTYGSKDFTTMTIKEFDDIVNKKTYGELEIITQKDKSVVYDFIDDPGYPHIFGYSPMFNLRQIIFKPNDDRSITYVRGFDNTTDAKTTFNNIIITFMNAGGKSIGKVKGYATSAAFTFKEFPGLTIRMILNNKHVSLNFWYEKSSSTKNILTQIENIIKRPLANMQNSVDILSWDKQQVINHLEQLKSNRVITNYKDNIFANEKEHFCYRFNDNEMFHTIGDIRFTICNVSRVDVSYRKSSYELYARIPKDNERLSKVIELRDMFVAAGGKYQKLDDNKFYDEYKITFPKKKELEINIKQSSLGIMFYIDFTQQKKQTPQKKKASKKRKK